MFWLLTFNKQTFAGFALKKSTLLKTRSGISRVLLKYIKIYQQTAFELILSQPYGWISEKFLRRSLLQPSAHIQNDLVYICFFKVGLSSSKNISVICLIESLLKMVKNAFCFILNALFVHKIFKFLPRLFSGHVGKTAWLEK